MTKAAKLRGRLRPVILGLLGLPPDPAEQLDSVAVRVHRSGAQILEAAIDERLDGQHREPEPPVRHVAPRPATHMVARA